MPGIVEQTLLEQQNIDLNEMVTMNQRDCKIVCVRMNDSLNLFL